MLNIVRAIEISAAGVFSDSRVAEKFNQQPGDMLHLHKIRTTLNFEEFNKVYFSPNAEGSYLEKCCGKGNVVIKVTKSSFWAIEAVSGSITDYKVSSNIINEKMNINFETNKLFNASCLLTLDEVKNRVANPFKFVLVRNFGIVNTDNLKEFLKEYDHAYQATYNIPTNAQANIIV